MKRFSTISMALVFGSLMLAASTASAKGHPSCNSSCHHHHNGCDSGCHKPCDPCKGNGKCGSGGGVVVDPPAPHPTHPIYPIIGKYPVTTVFGQPAPTKTPGGLAGRFGGQTITQVFGQNAPSKGGSQGGSLLGGIGHSVEGLGNTVVQGVEDAVNSLTGWL